MSVNLGDPTEAQRLAALHRYDILDTPPDGAFERITSLAARLFNVPISIVSLVDSDRIWFKSHFGIETDQIGRDPGLCASAILQDDPWVVSDAKIDVRTLANPLVAGEFGLRFYAGVPLKTSDGYNLGTICVIDLKPREVSDEELATLRDLASVVMDEMELRLAARRTVGLEVALRRHAEDTARVLQEGLLPDKLPSLSSLALEARYHVAEKDRVGGDFYDVVPTDEGCVAFIGDACGKGTRAAALTGTVRWALRTLTIGLQDPAEILGHLNRVLREGASSETRRYCTVAVASFRYTAANQMEVRIALGGHPRPILVRRDGAVERTGTPSPIVGWTDGVVFSESAYVLNKGDYLVMFTDGLLEVIGGHGNDDDLPIVQLLGTLPAREPAVVAEHLDARIAGTLKDDAAFVIIAPS